jgi:hypothetical protein
MAARQTAIISLSATNWPLIEPHLAKIVAAVDNALPASFSRVECGRFHRRQTPK